jgi:hypothetical protein
MGKASRLPEPQRQHRRLTHAHAAAAGGTRHGAPAPNLSTASNGPKRLGDGRRHAGSSLPAPHDPCQPVRYAHHRTACRPTPASGPAGPSFVPTGAPRRAHVFLKRRSKGDGPGNLDGFEETVGLHRPCDWRWVVFVGCREDDLDHCLRERLFVQRLQRRRETEEEEVRLARFLDEALQLRIIGRVRSDIPVDRAAER